MWLRPSNDGDYNDSDNDDVPDRDEDGDDPNMPAHA